ncbi:MAG: SsrA-binding protein [Candidatus Saccharibacteria bacterium]|nr:SsrA-binding protein [Candidatus Saccharibacteria bacterium]MDO4967658.1 SsrA-binding protein [Candidatus Saccharibacteria bacterium]
MGQKKSKKQNNSITVNRRASFDYKLGEEIQTGMVLTGPEVRLIRDHHVQLKGSFVTLKDNELWLNNLTLGPDTARNIKLLATKKQIRSFEKAKQDGMTIVPTKLFGGSRYIKLNIAVAEGKKKYDKRLSIKKKDLDREKKRRMF